MYDMFYYITFYIFVKLEFNIRFSLSFYSNKKVPLWDTSLAQEEGD